MKMKEVMKATGLQENTIRFYETKELISPEKEHRNGRTYHEYSTEDVQALKQIVVLRKARFTLDEIRIMQTNPERIEECVQAQSMRINTEVKELRQIGNVFAA